MLTSTAYLQVHAWLEARVQQQLANPLSFINNIMGPFMQQQQQQQQQQFNPGFGHIHQPQQFPGFPSMMMMMQQPPMSPDAGLAQGPAGLIHGPGGMQFHFGSIMHGPHGLGR